MKRIIFVFMAVLALVAIAGCNLFLRASGISTAGNISASSSKMASYIMFEPASEADLEVAAASGEVNAGYVIVKVAPEFDSKVFKEFGATVAGHFDFNGYSYFRLYKKGGAVKLVAQLSKTKGVIYAQHELISRIPYNEASSDAAEKAFSESKGPAQIHSVLNDPMTWGRFGHFETTKAIDAYSAYGVGNNLVYVVDIDTGINRIHEDFIDENGKQIVEYAKSAFDSTDHGKTFTFVGDGNPFIDVPLNENWDEEGHGTHTAGTIAAIGNNGKGVAGVAWKNVKLISYKCFSDSAVSGSGSDWAVYGGFADLINWKNSNSISQTIPVNMSLGSSWAGYFELDMINQALKNNIMVIASMGNSGYNAPQYPAAYSGVMAVGATRADGSKVHFSTSGNFISVSAPGYNIYSTFNKDNSSYADMSGTSMSAPFITGTIAYLLTFNKDLKPDQLRAIIESTSTDIGDAGWDEDTGYGLVNVKAAVDRIKNNDIPISGSVYTTQTTKIYVRNTNSYYNSGISGYPSAVVGQPIYIYDSDGMYKCLGLTNAIDGSAEFKLLKPGTYTAKTNYMGTMKQQSFIVNNNADNELYFDYNIATLLIQTVPNLEKDPYYNSWADTVITLYDDTGNIIAGPYDSGWLDTLAIAGLESGKTYYVGITQYNSYSTGEYGLNIGFEAKDDVSTTNGRGTGVDDLFEENDTLNEAQSVAVSTDYGLYQGDADYFKFVMP
ncbi:TPA: hypothetical protein ENX78_10410 [Candidatus Poribacteria bacterium]|nr:hypothetical protein [Candidatus Poribacteria bacterium]